MSDLKDRLEEFAKASGLGGLAGLDTACGFNKNTLTKKTEGMNTTLLLKVVDKFPRLKLNWVITGFGPMLNSSRHQEPSAHSLPLIPLEAFAGPGMPAYDDQRIEDFYTVTEFKESDFLIRVKGDSMTPKYSGGDLVACKKIPMSETYFLQWGRVYVIGTRSQGIMIKRVQKAEDPAWITCVSDNPKYAPFDVPKEDIVSIALVNGAITLD